MALQGQSGSDPLQHAWQVHCEASALGFDWPDIYGVFEKVREEIAEIEHAWQTGDKEHAKRELGDLLFASINLARFLDASPADELNEATERFSRRFELLKKEVERQGKIIRQCSLAELDVIWEQVKKQVRDVEKRRAT